MNRNLARAVWIIVGIITLALVPARAQREAAGTAAQPVDRPKMHRIGANASAQHYIVVMEDEAAGGSEAAVRLLRSQTVRM